MRLKFGVAVSLLVALPIALGVHYLPQSFWPRFLLIGGYASAVCIVIGWLLIDRPILELMRAMEQNERYDFLNRAAVRSRDVVGQLAKSFNRLLERITTLDAFKLETEKQLKVIGDFSQQVVATLDLDELFQILDELLGDKLGFQEFALLLREEEGDEVVVQIARGFADTAKVRGMRFRSDEGLTGHVLQSRQPCYIRNTREEPRYLYYKGEKREDGSFLSIPLLYKERVVGILNFNRPGVDAFLPLEIQFLNTVAVEVAIALVNARLYSKTRELAVRDELTRLYNRRHFFSVFPLEIKRAQRFGQPVSVLMIDIDRFKQYNDTFGHLKGDERLRELSGLLAGKIREVDFLARYGGEEFVALLPNTPKQDAVMVADKLRVLIRSHPFGNSPQELEHPISISVGIAAYPDDGDNAEGVLTAADQALYQAKGAGRDRVVPYFPK